MVVEVGLSPTFYLASKCFNKYFAILQLIPSQLLATMSLHMLGAASFTLASLRKYYTMHLEEF
jgi:hypothetical protein